jgi:hypothetical protein
LTYASPTRSKALFLLNKQIQTEEGITFQEMFLIPFLNYISRDEKYRKYLAAFIRYHEQERFMKLAQHS